MAPRLDLWGDGERSPCVFKLEPAVRGRKRTRDTRERERERNDPVFVQIWLMSAYTTFYLRHTPGTVAARLIMGCASRVRTSFRLGRSFTPFFYRVPRAIDSGQGPKGIRRLHTGPWREVRFSSFICSLATLPTVSKACFTLAAAKDGTTDN